MTNETNKAKRVSWEILPPKAHDCAAPRAAQMFEAFSLRRSTGLLRERLGTTILQISVASAILLFLAVASVYVESDSAGAQVDPVSLYWTRGAD